MTTLASGGKSLVRVMEAANFLSLSRSKVYQLMEEGRIRSVKIGRSRRIPFASLEGFANGLVTESAKHAAKSKRVRR